MKDNFFEMLLNLFEKTLTQLKEKHESLNDDDSKLNAISDSAEMSSENENIFVKAAHVDSIRVFTDTETMKLTKASYQFLMRMESLGVLEPEVFELIMGKLLFSDSRLVSLEETKWMIRHTIANKLDPEQLAFLDLVLYDTEDQIPLH